MASFAEVVNRRRMTRSFSDRPLPPHLLEKMVDLASRAPSAGKSQGWDLVVLEGADTALFWDATLPGERRDSFVWHGLLNAPVICLVFADPGAYLERYSEPDKAHTGLGSGPQAWPVPYWTVDTSMAAMILLLAAEDAGLGALFFAVFNGEEALRQRLGVPEDRQLLGAIALGYRSPAPARTGRSATRPRRGADVIIHRGAWSPPPAGADR